MIRNGECLRRNIQLREIPSLDGLRAFASLTVVLCHVVSPLYPGRQAVTLFFVLSGFLITLRLINELEQRGTIDILAFYVRRARRLLPAYYFWIGCVVVLLTGRITMQIVAAALYLSDYYAAWIREGKITHIWSLSVEEHFYLLWPAALLFLFRRKSKFRILVAVIAAIQVARLFLAARYPLYFYYSFEVRLDALLLGCGLALWLKDERRVPALLLSRVALMISLAGLVGGSFLPLFWMHATGATVGAYCSLLLIVQTVNAPPWILNNRVTSALGAWSYSLYLYHVLVRWVYMGLVPGAVDGTFSVHGWMNRLAVIGLSIAAAWASYRFVECPYLRGRTEKSRVRPPLTQGDLVLAPRS